MGASIVVSPLRAQAGLDVETQRQRLVDQVAAQMKSTRAETGRSDLSECVLRAMRTVPRHRFVPAHLVADAYLDRPLPIGMGQTISQPFVVALMTELLGPRPDARVLEIGTGSGYQAAVLAGCVAKVYTIEIVAPLGQQARALLAELGYANVEVRIGDGYQGWPEAAPFDGIVVTAAPDHVPQPLVDQLAPNGRMVIPVGSVHGLQDLLVISKGADGRAVTKRTIPVRFVPLTRER
ncbi:MAG: protein-L-isoaspartate(D-aspartate) O-methyltransferase [Burkholderiales bacterium]|nr:protein-L-isoaspartate(D-aspartate) O-methyltransferase [Burkholderiales bacterium]